MAPILRLVWQRPPTFMHDSRYAVPDWRTMALGFMLLTTPTM
jgi:hypothetical protein